ncbi:MAG TPA: DegV family protein [Erysipelotrichaceae bacterium]|nr:DegV family protein [Erysipelotrichaceae bacterium]
MAIKVYTDAGSNLFPSVLEKVKKDIKVVSMNLTIEDIVYRCYADNIDVDSFSQSFYQQMREGKKIYTSQVNPHDFLEAFKDDIDAGNQIICFVLAKGISGTYNSACLARDIINEEQGKEMVYIVDSATAGFGEGLQAIHACELVKKGLDFKTICEKCEKFKFKVRSEFTVGDIKYLIKKGRVSALVAKFINFIKVKFLLKGGNKSKIEVSGKVFGRKMALRKLVETCIAKIKNPEKQTVYITHCDVYDDALAIKNQLVENGIKNVEIYYYDLITGSHIGPDSLALFYVGENRN